MTESLPNAKPKLLGSDTHAAELTGSVVTEASGTAFAQNLSGSTTDFSARPVYRSYSANSQILTITLTVAAGESIVLFVQGRNFSGGTGGTGTLRRDTTTVASGVSLSTSCSVYIDEDPGAGTYDYNILNGGTQLFLLQLNLAGRVIGYSDTHTATLSGSNTENVHETEVLP